MEEEPVENDLEERMYAALHYVDDTQPEIPDQKSSTPNFYNAQPSTIRRYWRTNENVTSYNKSYSNKTNTSHSKVNTPNEKETNQSDTICNEKPSSEPDAKLSLFQLPIPSNLKPTIEILDSEVKSCIVELETSDEDEVIEVELPPKPTITIESSDEEDIITTTKQTKKNEVADEKVRGELDRITSPVPSVVSSISDDFIRGDCIALNITSKSNLSTLDSTTLYSALGSDREQTPAKKNKKKRKTKDGTSTPLSSKTSIVDVCFATPKSKEKNKKQKTKSYQVTDTSIPSADVYDSDSNQSTVETSNATNYRVTDRSMPSTDVYESDSNHSENKDNPNKSDNIMVSDVDSSEPLSETENIVVTPKKVPDRQKSVIDLTETIQNESINIEESIVMANVTGFLDDTMTIENRFNKGLNVDSNFTSKCGSTKIPAILNEDLDFDNLKGNKVSKKRKYSLTALRAEMEKFYNESWGGENFNHREIQKNMSRDKSLWAIDPKDRMPALAKRKTICNVCNRVGHRDDTCRLKTPICHMCGLAGHYEPRCPKKICVNCGSPNHVYTTMCRNCCGWRAVRCAECGQCGHPASHCPDVWRRYHNTLSSDVPLEENRQTKKQNQMFCSGCTRRGHLVHTCRLSVPFGELPIYSPYVVLYRPVYRRDLTTHSEPNKHKQQKRDNQDVNTPRTDRNKRQSKSPVSNEFQNKKRNLGPSEDAKNNPSVQQRKNSHTKENKNDSVEVNKQNSDKKGSDGAPDFIAVSSSNHDEKGQIIQDNEVSDTSEVITSARIYITSEISDALKTPEGCAWLKQASDINKIIVENTDKNFYISIKGTVGNQEAFQAELRDWIKSKQPKESRVSESDANSTTGADDQMLCENIPKNRNNVLRKIKGALDSLKADIGDPKALYKELIYLQNRQQQLMKQHVVSPKQLSNNRGNIRMMQRKLNMVLLGQAGLADGTKHLNELCSLQEKVTNYRNKSIPPSLRQEIGEHFQPLFTTPRDDYQELVNIYYNRSPVKALAKRRRKKLKITPSISQTIDNHQFPPNIIDTQEPMSGNLSKMKRRLFKNVKTKLLFFKKRLENTKPADSAAKMAKGRIMRDLQLRISEFGDIEKCSNQDLKRSKKTQQQAKELLRSLEARAAAADNAV